MKVHSTTNFAGSDKLIRLYTGFPSYEAFLSALHERNTEERKIMKESNDVREEKIKFSGSVFPDDD